MNPSGLTRLPLAALAVVLVAILLMACSKDKDSESGKDNPARLDQQVLRTRVASSDPKTIDPHLANFGNETTLDKPLFSTLFTFDESLRAMPDLASELPTPDNGGISKDGLVYTIKIRKDAKWSDGKPLTANDFVYSLKRAMDPKLAGPYTSNYFMIKGAEAYNTAFGTKEAPKTATDGELTRLRDEIGVKAKDDSTLEYTLIRPSPSFLNLMAIWTAYPVRQDIVEKYGDRWTEPGNIISNGAFILTEWAHNERLVMQPNPNWHREKPKLSKLIIYLINDDTAAYAAYLNNELDIATVPPANRREIQEPSNPLNKELIRGGDATTFALMMNNKIPPFDNVKVRQAFGTAFDRRAFVNAALQGAGRPATTWIASNQPGHNPELGKPYDFNSAKAKQLLSEAGFPDGRGLPKVTFLAVSNDTNRNVVAPFVIENYKKNLGVEVEFEFVDSASYTSRYTKNQHQVAIGGWHMDWPFPDNWLPNILGCNQSNNHTNYCSEKFDDLMKKAAAENDTKKQLAIYEEGQKLALEEAALMPIYEREYFLLVKPWVKGLVITGLDNATAKGDYYYDKVFIQTH